MWLLFHANTKTRPVKDGERFVETCPQCKDSTTFIEVEVEENVGVWFVDVVGDKRRAYRCTSCANTFDVKDERTLPKAQPARTLPRPATNRRAEAAKQIASEIEDELAAIKARLGAR